MNLCKHYVQAAAISLAVGMSVFSHTTAGAGYVYEYDPNEFAVAIIEYVEGSGIGADWISGLPFNDSMTALGRPTIDTTGDNWFIPLSESVPVVPVYPPFRSFEVVSIGHDGHIILMFDHPIANHSRNPYGVDFVVFGSVSLVVGSGQSWINRDPSLVTVDDSGGFTEPGTVSVSQDGVNWHVFSDQIGPHADPEGPYDGTDGPYADVFAPTLGRVYDPENPEASIGDWNEWWSVPTDPTIPLDPRMKWSDFYGMTVADIAREYEDSAGGTGFDLDWLEVPGLDWIQYVRIEGPAEGWTPEIDAVSDVFPHLGDFDHDADVDLADFAAFQPCFTGPDGQRTLRDCFPADFDGNPADDDMDVDLDDYRLFAEQFNGPGPAG